MSVTQAVLKRKLSKLGIKTYRDRTGKRFVKRTHVLAALEVLAGALPDKDYPPANVAKMIKECENAGRSDLGEQIMMQWNKVIEKYPQTRVNWGAATKIGTSSIKKNIFGGVDFHVWLSTAESLSPEMKKEIQKIPTIGKPPQGTPAIAIPTDSEQPEDWATEAEKTKGMLANIQESIGSGKDFIKYLSSEIADLKKKIVVYGPGGEKELTKAGKPGKLSLRVPKWEVQLDAFEAQLQSTSNALAEAAADMKASEAAYNEAPVTTVAYEKKAQSSLDSVLEFILNMEDLEKQQKMLEKFNETLKNLEKKTVAHLITADVWDSARALFDKIMTTIKSKTDAMAGWVKGLNSSINEFSELANMR